MQITASLARRRHELTLGGKMLFISEYMLAKMAAEIVGESIEEFASNAIVTAAKSAVATSKSGDSGAGVRGSADNRMREAIEVLQRAREPLTPARVASVAKTNYYTAKRFLASR